MNGLRSSEGFVQLPGCGWHPGLQAQGMMQEAKRLVWHVEGFWDSNRIYGFQQAQIKMYPQVKDVEHKTWSQSWPRQLPSFAPESVN